MAGGGQLELRAATKRFGPVVALDAVDLDVRPGRFVALIGPTGCGKTTTLRAVAGLEDLTSGSISIDGRRVDTEPPHRRGTALVWQHFVLFPHLNVLGNVEFGLKMRGVERAERRTRAREMLDLLGLNEFGDRAVQSLSSGQRQRVGLARALVTEPRVLLLDEPLGSLDASLKTSIQRELMSHHRRSGMTFVLVTHDQNEALAMADEVVVMNRGRIEQVGSPKELFDAPQTVFVARFVGRNNVWEASSLEVERGQLVAVTVDGRFVLGKVAATAPSGSLVVRADRLRVVPDGGASGNTIRGVVIVNTRVGAFRFARVRTAAGTSIDVLANHEALRPGSTVQLSWEASAAHIIPTA